MEMKKDDMQKLQQILTSAGKEAIRLGNAKIQPEHLFLAILRTAAGEALDILVSLDLDFFAVNDLIENNLKKEKGKIDSIADLGATNGTKTIINNVQREAERLGDDHIDTEHVMLSILKNLSRNMTHLLKSAGIDYKAFMEQLLKTRESKQSYGDLMTAGEFVNGFSDDDDGDDDDDDDDDERDEHERLYAQQVATQTTAVQSSGPSKTPFLDNFGTDLTRQAEAGSLDPIIGRDKEIERLVQILSRRKKNNPVLIGESGVGKSAIAEGLALKIVQKKVPGTLWDKRVVSLDMTSIVAGTKYRGQFEERIKAILHEITKCKNVILFIDEIHTIVGGGAGLDAANMLKPALAKGDLQCIGATTLDEYRQNIEKDGALERRFQKVLVDPTTAPETLEILANIKSRYEDHHNVTYTDEAIQSCVKLTVRYVPDRLLPDKAIDALDEAGARVHINNISVPVTLETIEKELADVRNKKKESAASDHFEEAAACRDKELQLMTVLEKEKEKWKHELNENRVIVTEEHVAEVVAMMTGVPVQRIAKTENMKLLQMHAELAEKIVGQDEAIEKIVKAIHRNRTGLKDPNRPIGSFIFLGPTGVGKTQLAKVLAKYLFDSDDALIRIDMSEYTEKFSVSRLVGAPPGYVGYEEGGQLTEKVRRKPYSVILLDEIEKAHPEIFNLLLQMLDDGQLTDSLGRKVDFKNTIIIMTSNAGTRQLKDFGRGIGFGTENRMTDKKYTTDVLSKSLKNTFSPEFLNRIDDVIYFNFLTKENIHKIIDIELSHLSKRVDELGYTLNVSQETKEFLTEKGYDPQYGVRPLKRTIQKYLENELAEAILKKELSTGGVLETVPDKEMDKVLIKSKRAGKISGNIHKEKNRE
ncbi:ATP-dependent Clp protease ClpC [Bacteroidia bacterium]|nr:ATP-dependent Clp protease ClpC [Bacteroidia bacterium]